MEDKNIYKVVLNYINVGSLDQHIKKDSIYINNLGPHHSQNEPIELLVKKRLEQYYEYYHSCKAEESLWSTMEIIVYWDRKSAVAHEITTGALIPLLMLTEQNDKNLLNGIKKCEDGLELPLCNSYTKPSEFGYFAEISYYDVETKTRKKHDGYSLVGHLEELKDYFKQHPDHDLFYKELNNIFEESKQYMKSCLISMTKNIQVKTDSVRVAEPQYVEFTKGINKQKRKSIFGIC